MTQTSPTDQNPEDPDGSKEPSAESDTGGESRTGPAGGTTNASTKLTPVVVGKALAGSVAGVIVGAAGFSFLLSQGLYAIVLPGAAVGLGTGLMSRRASWTLAIYSGVIGAVLCLLLEWRYFHANVSLGEFLSGIGDLDMQTQLRMAAGVVAAVWFGRGRQS